MRELSGAELDTVGGGMEWWQRVVIGAMPLGGVVLAAYDLQQSYQAGWDGAHGRASRD